MVKVDLHQRSKKNGLIQILLEIFLESSDKNPSFGLML
jgi:hypothetical protein